MKYIIALLFFFAVSILSNKTKSESLSIAGNMTALRFDQAQPYTYLALGDSYTIGEAVPPVENFPNQVASLMKADSITLIPPRIIAKTGWTTDELEAGIKLADADDPLNPTYDFVSLLIGVNNQYRGRSVK